MEFTEGRNNNYLVHGVFTTLIIGILSMVTKGLLLPLLLIPIGLFAAKNGLEVDFYKKRYRIFGSFFGFHFGKWYSYQSPTKVILILSSENASLGGSVVLTGYFPKMSSKSLTYNVLIQTESGNHLLFESLSYRFAQTIAKSIAKKYEIGLEDKVAEKLRKRNVRKAVHQ